MRVPSSQMLMLRGDKRIRTDSAARSLDQTVHGVSISLFSGHGYGALKVLARTSTPVAQRSS